MKKALIYYPHGLGDCIMLTPCLRKLYKDGYITTLVCHPEVPNSGLFLDSPYVKDYLVVENPWKTVTGENRKSRDRGLMRHNIDIFEKKANSKEYDFYGMSLHNDRKSGEHKAEMTARQLGIKPEDYNYEVWIPEGMKEHVADINKKFNIKPYVFLHNHVPDHPYHNWNDAAKWVRENVVEKDLRHYRTDKFEIYPDKNINYTFEVMRQADYRVICSSVFVHACEALGLTIDCLYHGRRDEKVFPMNEDFVLNFICKEG